MDKGINSKALTVSVIIISFISIVAFAYMSTNYREGDDASDGPLPDKMNVEESISRRMSIRSFSSANVTLGSVEYVLWGACGYTQSRTFQSLCGNYPLVIYAIHDSTAYVFNPETKSLNLWKKRDFSTIM